MGEKIEYILDQPYHGIKGINSRAEIIYCTNHITVLR